MHVLIAQKLAFGSIWNGSSQPSSAIESTVVYQMQLSMDYPEI